MQWPGFQIFTLPCLFNALGEYSKYILCFVICDFLDASIASLRSYLWVSALPFQCLREYSKYILCFVIGDFLDAYIASLRNFPCESDFHSVWHVRALVRHLVIGSGLTKMVSYQCHGWVWDDKSIMEYKSQNFYFGIAMHNEKIAFGEFCCLWLESILVCECEWQEYTRRSKTSRQSSQLAVDQHCTGPPPP